MSRGGGGTTVEEGCGAKADFCVVPIRLGHVVQTTYGELGQIGESGVGVKRSQARWGSGVEWSGARVGEHT